MSIVTCIILPLLKVNVTQLCPTLYDPMDYMVHGVLQVRILEWVVFPFSRGSSQPRDQNQGLNPGLPNCRQILYQLSHKGSLRILEWVAYPFSSRSSQPRNWTGVSCIAGGFFTNWAIREAPIINSANIHWASALEARDKWCIKINFYSHEASKLSFIYLTTIWF